MEKVKQILEEEVAMTQTRINNLQDEIDSAYKRMNGFIRKRDEAVAFLEELKNALAMLEV